MCGVGGECTCGCCEGIGVSTPVRIHNRPGLAAVGYRVGQHASFKASLLARLSSADFPALTRLQTRDDDDFTIALCDGAAVMLDVLTFYQERIANESFLRTAGEQRSVLELARLIGYQLAPGVAASTHVAFTLQTTPGDPTEAAQPVTIASGTRVQSVPGPDELPQTFETIADVPARADWNEIAVQTSIPWVPAVGDTSLYLAGTSTQLQPGDVLLIVGRERLGFVGSEQWDVRVLRSVEADSDFDRTRVRWGEGLGSITPPVSPAQQEPRVYVFRQRAALFGHNAPDSRLISVPTGGANSPISGDHGTWVGFDTADAPIDLDAAYNKVVAGGWVALVSDDDFNSGAGLTGYIELYRARSVAYPTRNGFGISAKVTRIVADTSENRSVFDRRGTLALAQSEELRTTGRPIFAPLHGDGIAFSRIVEALRPAQPVAVSGKRQRVRVLEGVTHLAIVVPGGARLPLAPNDTVRLAEPPSRLIGAIAQALSPEELEAALDSPSRSVLRMVVLDRDGRAGTLEAATTDVQLAPSVKEDETVHEIAQIDDAPDAIVGTRDRTTIRLVSGLRHCYDRATVRVNANVAPATHGEAVREVAGSGDATVRDQRLTLRQAPLTYVSADTPDGRASTLEVRVNDLRWTEVPSLFERGSDDRVYATQIDETGRATVLFGDGVEGARLPSGTDNVRASYRKGTGVAGNIAARRLTTLLSHPLGVIGATNPEPAAGGADEESLDDARVNAPLRVLTLDRAVSITDYQDYARAFAGIAKAHAIWVPSGPGRGIFITVAGIDGAAVSESGATHHALVASLRRFGDPLLPLRVATYVPIRVTLAVDVKVADDAEPRLVLAAVAQALRSQFGFRARRFGQSIAVDEIAAVIHGVPSVIAARVTRLYRTGSAPSVATRIDAAVPVPSIDTPPLPAELLTLDDAALGLGVMP